MMAAVPLRTARNLPPLLSFLSRRGGRPPSSNHCPRRVPCAPLRTFADAGRFGFPRGANCVVFAGRTGGSFSGPAATIPRAPPAPSALRPPQTRGASTPSSPDGNPAARPSALLPSAAEAFVRRLRWKIFARIAYYLRVPFLVLSVYGMGYSQGIMDHSRDPRGTEATLLESAVTGAGCEDAGAVRLAKEGESGRVTAMVSSAKSFAINAVERERTSMLRDVARAGEKIVVAARAHVKSELERAVKTATAQMPPDVVESEERLYSALMEDEHVDTWTKALRHVEGPWSFLLLPSPVPNAFVTEMLPFRIFITTSMISEFISNEDELALVLGHELSHLILGHSSETNTIEMFLRTLEILLLGLDPTEGVLSLGFMAFLASVRRGIGASHSREHERQADELGIKLTAMACYDTAAATRVFYKMHLKDTESTGRATAGGWASFFDTHPPTEERFEYLAEKSGVENQEKYRDTSCASLKNVFQEAMQFRAEGGPGG